MFGWEQKTGPTSKRLATSNTHPRPTMSVVRLEPLDISDVLSEQGEAMASGSEPEPEPDPPQPAPWVDLGPCMPPVFPWGAAISPQAITTLLLFMSCSCQDDLGHDSGAAGPVWPAVACSTS